MLLLRAALAAFVLIAGCFCTTCADASALLWPRSPPRAPPAHVTDLRRCLCEYGFAFAPGFGKQFAQEYIRLMGADIAKRKKQIIAGGVEQFAMPQTGSSPWPAQLREAWHALVAKLAESAGVEESQLQLLVGNKSASSDAAAAASSLAAAAASADGKMQSDDAKPQLHVQDEKLLIAGRQKGEQVPHFDRDDTARKLRQVYTIILYLTDGVDSTAFPQFPLDDFALPEFDAQQEVQNAAAMRATVERGCLEKERYDRWPVRIGDMALFTQATMVRQQQQQQHIAVRVRWLCFCCCCRECSRWTCLLCCSTSAPRTTCSTSAWRCSACSRRSKRSARTTTRSATRDMTTSTA
jgi:hypothetical protein